MTDVEIGQSLRAATAAGRDLRDALAAGESPDAAAERLAREIESVLAPPAPAGRDLTDQAVDDDPDALLAVVAAQLRLGELALAAGTALGETGAGPPPEGATATLDRALTEVEASEPAPRDRETVASHDLDEAVATLKARFGSTLDAIAKGTADVVAGPCRTIAGRAPAQWKEAWDKISKRLFLDNIGGRLLRLGMRAVAAALDALLDLVDATWLETARDRLVALADRKSVV